MNLQQKINQDFLEAFKTKKETVVSTLRMLKSGLDNKKIEKKIDKNEDLSDEDVVAIVKSEIKKRKDSIESFKSGRRDDLVDKEQKEVGILEKYLPAQMSQDQLEEIIKKVIAETGAKSPADFGRVMGMVIKEAKGQADGQVVSDLVKKELNE